MKKDDILNDPVAMDAIRTLAAKGYSPAVVEAAYNSVPRLVYGLCNECGPVVTDDGLYCPRCGEHCTDPGADQAVAALENQEEVKHQLAEATARAEKAEKALELHQQRTSRIEHLRGIFQALVERDRSRLAEVDEYVQADVDTLFAQLLERDALVKR